MNKYTAIDLFLTTQTPLHITAMSETNTRINDDGYLTSNSDGRQIARTTCSMINLQKPYALGNDRVTQEVLLPTINANTIRGAIKSAIDDIFFDSFSERGLTISQKGFHLLTALAFGTIKEGSQANVYEKTLNARNDLFAGVFGGGPDLFHSHLVTPQLLPVTDVLIENAIQPTYIISHIDDSTPHTYKHNYPHPNLCGGFTYAIDIFKKDRLLTYIDPVYEKIVSNYAESLKSHQDAVLKNRADRKNNSEKADYEKVKKTDLENMVAIEAVKAGTLFHCRLELASHLSDAQKGLVLLGLDRFRDKQQIGGNGRYGFGRYRLAYHVSEVNSSLIFDKSYYPDMVDEEGLEKWRQEASDAVNVYDEDQLKSVYNYA